MRLPPIFLLILTTFFALSSSAEEAKAQYTLANAEYREGHYETAAGLYDYVRSLSASSEVQSRCYYNSGNCMVKMAEALCEVEPQAATHYCQQAVWLYRAALTENTDFADAAYNLEIAQYISVGIEEKIHEQEEKEKQENELIQYIRKKLAKFIERQTQLMNQNQEGKPQAILEKETRALAKVMADSGLHTNLPLPDGTQIPGPLQKTYEHTLKAAEAMAIPDQPTALAELIAALGAAPEDPENSNDESDDESDNSDDYDMEYTDSDEDADLYEEADPFGDFSEYEEIRGVPPPNKTEIDILAEEVRNQERRKQKKAGAYTPVDKDW